jgi:uncharacterized protein (TIGR02117 family)
LARAAWRRAGRFVLRWTKRAALAFAVCLFLYLLAAVVLTLIPVNSDWQQPATGVEIFVISNAWHAEFTVPMTNEVVDWRQWVKDEHFRDPWPRPTHVRFGWGDRGFMLEVPKIADLRPGVALRALFMLSTTAVHVYQEPSPPLLGPRVRRLVVTPEQYRRLVEHIQASVARDADGAWRHIARRGHSTSGDDTFYEGTGRYSLFYTCNVWTNEGLSRMGVRTGLWAPFAPCVLWHLPAPPP